MQLFWFALLLLILPASTLGQTTFAGGSFGSSSPSRFGANGPSFADSSARSFSPPPEVITPPTVPPLLPYAYPVGPRRLAATQTPAGRIRMLVFRDQTVEATSSYWIEGTVLHYVTAFGASRMVPVKRINWKLTAKTNRLPT